MKRELRVCLTSASNSSSLDGLLDSNRRGGRGQVLESPRPGEVLEFLLLACNLILSLLRSTREGGRKYSCRSLDTGMYLYSVKGPTLS